MPQDKRRPTLSQPVWIQNPELFSLEALSTSEGLESASITLQTASSISGNPTLVLNSATTYLLTLPSCAFPLLLSFDAVINQEFSEALSSTFPTTAKEFMDSNQQKVLNNLKIFYHSLPPEEEDTETSKLDSIHLRLHRIAPALAIISQSSFGSASGLSPEPRSPMSPSEDGEIPSLVKKQRKKRARGASIIVDDGTFRDIGSRMPRGLEEAERLEKDLLEELKDTLKTYMACLLRPVSHKHASNLLSAQLTPISPTMIVGKSSPRTMDERNPISHAAIPQSPPLIGHLLSNHGQPIQLWEENVKDFGAWKILLAGKSIRNLRQIRRSDRHMFEIVEKKLKELSEGFFSRDNQKRLVGKDTEVPVYEAKMTNDTRLVYTIECIPEANGERVTQAIKMFGVYTHAQINSRLWAAVAHWSSKRGPEHRKRCTARATSKQKGGYVIPSSWPPIKETYEAPDVGFDTDTEFNLELHALLTHEKFVPLTQSVLDSIIADEESTHLFCVSQREHEIVHHPSSCFVVGRSGTGKTTTMLFKMLAIERTRRKVDGPKVRQVFVTQSRVLADKVEEYFNNLIQSSAKDSQTVEELEWRASKRKEIEKNLMELDEEDDSSSNLPSRFSQLEDKHFPLFLTFDKLCKLLEADFITPLGGRDDSLGKTPAGTRFCLADASDADFTLEDNPPPPRLKSSRFSPRDQKILYEDFRAKYWPHFPQYSTKGLDPALVWNEFQGVIRGSELSLNSPRGSLERTTYEGLSSRTQATFSRHRSRLYDIFEVYAKLKRERREVDSADRTHALLEYFQDNAPLASLDYIYVDEVQDNLLIDARLIRSLCHNPHGLFWAGDTAQQITSTAFRFSDLKAFLHRVEEADPMVQTQRRVAVHPKAFTLAINYRSHGGIINCAHSIVQLLTDLWPNSIDVLDREQGLVDGPKPVFFTGCDTDSAHYEQFLFGEANHRIEFGAQQCILVRNDAAREKLRQNIGDIGVIMTVYESKGLEFSDVLLYNFFEDSSVESEWRVVLNGIPPEKRAGIAVPEFNELRHTGVCSELKFLYVGLTRARNNLWIWDTSVWADPMKQFWESRGQIEIKTPGDHVPRLAMASSQKEWEEMGRLLFSRGNYQQAVICFDRAELPLLRDISHAYHLRKQARLLEAGSLRRKTAFFDAGNHFSKCGAGDHEQSQKCYIRAGECYAEAGKDMEASDAFCKAKEFSRGAQHARKAANFDRAVEIIQSHPVEEPVAAKIIGVCQVQFLREKAFKKARSLFDSDEDFLEHFDVFGFDKTPILVEVGRFEEAADLLLQSGNAVDAIKLYLRADSDSSRAKAGSALLEQWWRCLPFGASASAARSPTIEVLASLTSQVEFLDVGHEAEIGVFQTIFKNDNFGLTVCSEQLMKSGDVVTALRGLFHLFRNTEDTRAFDLDQMEFHLHNLHWFGTKLRSILGMVQSEFALALETQKLLGYRISGESLLREAVLLPSSAIIQRVSHVNSKVSRRPPREDDDHERVILVEEAGRIGRELLAEEFQAIIERHCAEVQRAVSFQPICIQYIAGNCQYSDCKYLHVSADGMKEAVNHRFRLFLHQILVINNMDFVMTKNSRRDLRRKWISRLMDVIYPQNNNVGNLVDITVYNDQQKDDLVRHGLIVLREWIRGAFYGLNPSYTDHVMELFLLATAVDHHGVPRYFDRVHGYLARRILSDGYRKIGNGHQRSLIIDLFNICFPRGTWENGVDYLQYMIQSRARLDAHAFVCVLELVTTRLLAGLKPDFHGLVIPRSWLYSLAQHRTWSPIPNLGYLPYFVESLISLVQNIERGADHLFVEGLPVRKTPGAKCTILVRRILRCLVLHGCNYGNDNDLAVLSQRITGLRSNSADSILPLNYMKADNWGRLAWIATQSSKTDAVIQLVKNGDVRPVSTLDGVDKYAFQDIPVLFSTFMESPLADYQPRKTLNPKARAFIPQRADTFGQEPVRDVISARHSPTPERKELSSNLRDGSEADTLFTKIHHDAARRIQIAYRRYRSRRDLYTTIHHDAARRIQLAYRRFRSRIAARPRSHALNHWFKECSSIGKLSQCSVAYRVVVLGPLPHLLVCANAFRKKLDEQKTYASRMMHTINHTELEEAMARLHQILNLRRQFLKYFHEVKPSSALHETANLADLTARVHELSSQIGPFCAERRDLKGHLELASKGILQVKKAAVAPIKPSLNTSDLYE